MKYMMHKGIKLPLIGFGTWRVGNDEKEQEHEIDTMEYGIKNYGMTLIDTAEMYGSGKSERVVAQVLKRFPREDIYLIDKILPQNATVESFDESLQKSLEILKTDCIDLYLLHWREDVNLQFIVTKMEEAKKAGLIKQWGVSNFDVNDMEDLYKCKGGSNCFANEILYNISERGVEYDLLGWCKDHDVLVIAYSPLANNAKQRNAIKQDENIQAVCKKKGITPEALMLSFTSRTNDIISIFKTGTKEHLAANMEGCFSTFDDEDIRLIEKSYQTLTEKIPLQKI